MTNGTLLYVTGDVTNPQITNQNLFLIHCCNTAKRWNKGFVLSLSKRWKAPEKEYLKWSYFNKPKFELGEIQAVPVTENITVINMIGQHGLYADKNGVPPIRYEAIAQCLEKVAQLAIEKKRAVIAPRFGAGLAACSYNGFNEEVWAKIETLLIEKLINKNIDVTIYTL